MLFYLFRVYILLISFITFQWNNTDLIEFFFLVWKQEKKLEKKIKIIAKIV